MPIRKRKSQIKCKAFYCSEPQLQSFTANKLPCFHLIRCSILRKKKHTHTHTHKTLADLNLSLKALRQPSQKFWPKILTPYFFYSKFYLTILRSCCENIFKIVCIVSEKIGKQISEFALVFLASIRSCLQFHWNWKYFSSAVLRLRGQLFMAPWHGFHLFDEER